ncbi:MAG TPA: ABC transporter permease subunit [Myxococcaceae bacterium]|nr:ABC transporter permease subunit [Myxococcaceae bacterium]
MRGAWTVCRKELVDHLRDRRSVLSALLFPVTGPALLALLFSLMISWQQADTPLQVAVHGAERAPHLVSFLRRYGAQVETTPADFESRVRSGALDLALEVPPDFSAEWTTGVPARVELVVDHSRNRTRTQVQRVRALLEGYSRHVGMMRLVVRGVDPALAHALSVDVIDVASPQQLAANVLSTIPLFLLMAAFVGGMNVAVDATAGERERGELESLLVNPVMRLALVIGKWLAAVVVSVAALLLTLVAFALTLRLIPLADLGLRATLNGHQALRALAILIPLSCATTAFQMGIATIARSVKEAQTYVSLLMLIPVVPGIFLSISPVRTAGWMASIPVLGQELLLNDTLRGDPVSEVRLVVAGATAVLMTALALAATARLLNREQVIFGR